LNPLGSSQARQRRSCDFNYAPVLPDSHTPLLNAIGIFFDGGAARTCNGHLFYPGSSATSIVVMTMRDDGHTQDIEIVNRASRVPHLSRLFDLAAAHPNRGVPHPSCFLRKGFGGKTPLIPRPSSLSSSIRRAESLWEE
jgi:hypothetical protein